MTGPALDLPPVRETASVPPEHRGVERDQVRLLVARRGDRAVHHQLVADLPDLLDPGDLLVVNTSATLPAALPATVAGTGPAALHVSGRLPAGLHLVELRHVDSDQPTNRPWLDATAGTRVTLPGAAHAELLAAAAGPRPNGDRTRLWVARLELPTGLIDYLAAYGRPIRYGHVPEPWPLESYQTVFALHPGSAEMPSAGRPFTPPLVTRLVAHGVRIAPLVLHTGVSSADPGELPPPEWYRVPPHTAEAVNTTRCRGRRVVAVGTSVVRALQTTAEPTGRVHPGKGWTELVVDTHHPATAVDGILTGWHEPGGSHLAMLETLAGRPLLQTSYRAAIDAGYLWHEFGDSHLILP